MWDLSVSVRQFGYLYLRYSYIHCFHSLHFQRECLRLVFSWVLIFIISFLASSKRIPEIHSLFLHCLILYSFVSYTLGWLAPSQIPPQIGADFWPSSHHRGQSGTDFLFPSLHFQKGMPEVHDLHEGLSMMA